MLEFFVCWVVLFAQGIPKDPPQSDRIFYLPDAGGHNKFVSKTRAGTENISVREIP